MPENDHLSKCKADGPGRARYLAKLKDIAAAKVKETKVKVASETAAKVERLAASAERVQNLKDDAKKDAN